MNEEERCLATVSHGPPKGSGRIEDACGASPAASLNFVSTLHVQIIRSLVAHYANECVHVHVDVHVIRNAFFSPKWYFFKIDRFRIFLEGPFALWCFTGYELKEVNARHPSETAMFLKSHMNCCTKLQILVIGFLKIL